MWRKISKSLLVGGGTIGTIAPFLRCINDLIGFGGITDDVEQWKEWMNSLDFLIHPSFLVIGPMMLAAWWFFPKLDTWAAAKFRKWRPENLAQKPDNPEVIKSKGILERITTDPLVQLQREGNRIALNGLKRKIVFLQNRLSVGVDPDVEQFSASIAGKRAGYFETKKREELYSRELIAEGLLPTGFTLSDLAEVIVYAEEHGYGKALLHFKNRNNV